MANSKNSASAKQVGTTLQALVAEGNALLEIWNKRQTAQRKLFTADTKADGFDTRLGKLLQELKAQSPLDSGQISRQTLATYKVDKIDRRRRSEALWFVENEVACRDFIQKSKKGYTSLSALQKAMYKASKEADTPTEAKASKGKSSAKAEKKVSDVGQKPSKDDIVQSIIKACQYSGIDLLDIAEALMDIDTVSETDNTETKVAA
jgi:hypothetical protein